MQAEKIRVKANVPQGRFLAMKKRFKAFVSGYGGGKTWVGGQSQCRGYWEFPNVNQGYFAPTYAMIRDIFYPTIEEVAYTFGLETKIKEGNHEIDFYNGRTYRGTTICRSLERPQTIVGFKIGHATIDELDTLPMVKAREAWRKIIARMRDNTAGVRNSVDVMTTPEGFRFTHSMFVQALIDKPALQNNYGIVQASTYDNKDNLPEDYIPSLLEVYPAELVQAYIDGGFVNMTSGTVYYSYNRVTCNSTETIKKGEPLFIGQDFNVGKMASAIFVQRPDAWHMVAELKDVFDTPALIRTLKERYPESRVIVYPDASGKSRKTVDASKSDIALLTQAGFVIRVNSTNPPIKDRVLATNNALARGRIKVNAKACPTCANCLEQHAYDKDGGPDKKSGHDHMTEAFSYFVAYEFPIIRPIARLKVVGC